MNYSRKNEHRNRVPALGYIAAALSPSSWLSFFVLGLTWGTSLVAKSREPPVD
jgi:hypothetical protein